MSLRVAVIGVGYLGRFHAQKLAAHPETELVAVCDPRPETARAVAEELKTRPETDYRVLKGQVDFVSVPASTKAHAEIAGFFLDHGVPTLVEKPIAATLEEAELLVAKAEKKGTFFAVGHIERYNPVYRRIREMLVAPTHFDLIRHTPFRSRGADVSVVHDLMIHDLDLLAWLAGADFRIENVSGGRWAGAGADVADAFVRFEDGRTATLSASRMSARPQRALRVLQKDAVLWADSASGEIEILRPRPNQEPVPQESLKVDKADALAAEIGDVVERLRTGVEPLVDGRAGLAALKKAEEISRRLGNLQ